MHSRARPLWSGLNGDLKSRLGAAGIRCKRPQWVERRPRNWVASVRLSLYVLRATTCARGTLRPDFRRRSRQVRAADTETPPTVIKIRAAMTKGRSRQPLMS